MPTHPTPPTVSSSTAHARAATAAMFFTNGALFANLLPRYPEIKEALAMSGSQYGFAVAAFPAGAFVVGPASGALIRRYGSGRVASVGTLVVGLGALVAGIAPAPAWFALALFVAGGTDAVADVAQNAHGLRVQKRYGRSIINSFHAVWSIGGVTGGAMAAGAIALDLPIAVHLGISAVLFGAVALVALRFALPGHEDDAEAGAGSHPTDASAAPRRVGPRTVGVLAALVVIAMAGTVVEDAGNSWAALYLAGSLQASATVAATGFVALIGAQCVGRLVGDRLVDRVGQRAVARSGGAITAAGMGLALAFPTVPGTIAGFAAAGFGVATLVPAAVNEADDLPGLRPGTGLTVVSWLMRIGFLASPPLVGSVTDAVGLRVGLVVVPAVGLVVVLLAGVLRRSSGAAVA